MYVCSQCGYETPRWLGRCPDCGSWNTLEEQQAAPESKLPEKKIRRAPGTDAEALRVDLIPDESSERRSCGIGELDRVLGGGLVAGSLVLVGGDPGIGKSTLLTQVCANLADAGETVLYVSGEESARQIKMRANRLGASGAGFYVLSENDVNGISKRMEQLSPSVMVIDSIQTMYLPEIASAPGSVSQVRECASLLMRLAKNSGCSVFLVGHVTKEGSIAGPRILEHMVDAVLCFEGEKQMAYRVIRAAKNRFGSTNEIGVFEMTAQGLLEVPNPSAAMLEGRPTGMPGNCAVCIIEGTRPIIAEVQALAAPTVFSVPRRTSNGIDYSRLYLLLAVLEKRLGIPFSKYDVYINVVGGLHIDEPSADTAICLALISCMRDIPVDDRLIAMGEIGLSGECRGISDVDARVGEARRLGFDKVVLPRLSMKKTHACDGAELYPVGGIYDLLKVFADKSKA